MKTRTPIESHRNLIDIQDVIVNHVGDVALTPDGLHYMGMISWVTQPLSCGVHFPVPNQRIRTVS